MSISLTCNACGGPQSLRGAEAQCKPQSQRTSRMKIMYSKIDTEQREICSRIVRRAEGVESVSE